MRDGPSALELPAVDERLCTACGLCVAVCPTVCLALGRSLPRLPRPLDCVSCGLCVAVCPTAAMKLE